MLGEQREHLDHPLLTSRRKPCQDHLARFGRLHATSLPRLCLCPTLFQERGDRLLMAMPGGHMQWRERANDLLVEMLSCKVGIGAIVEQQGGCFRQTLLDGEVQQPPISAGGTDQGRVGIQQGFGPIELIECNGRCEISIAVPGTQEFRDMLLSLYDGKAERRESPGGCRMHIRASVQQQGHHVWAILLNGEVQRLLALVHNSQWLTKHRSVFLDQGTDSIWLSPSDCREDVELCALREQEVRNLVSRSFATTLAGPYRNGPAQRPEVVPAIDRVDIGTVVDQSSRNL